jgi:hypothetical protein
LFGGCNVGLHNYNYPDNALIYRRERLVIYETGTTMNMATCGLCIVYAHSCIFLGVRLRVGNLPERRLGCDVSHIEIVVKWA